LSRESRLLRRIRQWDTKALAQVYDRYSGELYAYAARQLGDRDLAEECVAATFERLLASLSEGKGPTRHLRAYLYRIAHHWIVDQWRAYREVALEAASHDDVAVSIPDPRPLAEQQVALEAVRRALASLTPEQRQVLALRYIEGWSLRETAQAMGRTVGAVKALQHRALAALRRALSEG